MEDYDALRNCLAGYLQRGVRLAIDDAGAGYSSLRHVVELSPDYLKLDRELVSGIDQDPNRRALMRAVVAFAREVGTSVIAEGVETSRRVGRPSGRRSAPGAGLSLARPGPPWPDIEHTGPPKPRIGKEGGGRPNFGEDGLQQALARVDNVLEACEVAAETLYRHSHLLTSLYLERNHELRCLAQRGLWQVLDGMPGTAGITGRTWATATSVVVEDVSTRPSVPSVGSRGRIRDLRADPCQRRRGRLAQCGVVQSIDPGGVGDDRVSCSTPGRSSGGDRHQPWQLSMASGCSCLGGHLRAPLESPPAQPSASPLHRCRRDGLGCLIIDESEGAVGPDGRRAAGRESDGP